MNHQGENNQNQNEPPAPPWQEDCQSFIEGVIQLTEQYHLLTRATDQYGQIYQLTLAAQIRFDRLSSATIQAAIDEMDADEVPDDIRTQFSEPRMEFGVLRPPPGLRVEQMATVLPRTYAVARAIQEEDRPRQLNARQLDEWVAERRLQLAGNNAALQAFNDLVNNALGEMYPGFSGPRNRFDRPYILGEPAQGMTQEQHNVLRLNLENTIEQGLAGMQQEPRERLQRFWSVDGLSLATAPPALRLLVNDLLAAREHQQVMNLPYMRQRIEDLQPRLAENLLRMEEVLRPFNVDELSEDLHRQVERERALIRRRLEEEEDLPPAVRETLERQLSDEPREQGPFATALQRHEQAIFLNEYRRLQVLERLSQLLDSVEAWLPLWEPVMMSLRDVVNDQLTQARNHDRPDDFDPQTRAAELLTALNNVLSEDGLAGWLADPELQWRIRQFNRGLQTFLDLPELERQQDPAGLHYGSFRNFDDAQQERVRNLERRRQELVTGQVSETGEITEPGVMTSLQQRMSANAQRLELDENALVSARNNGDEDAITAFARQRMDNVFRRARGFVQQTVLRTLNPQRWNQTRDNANDQLLAQLRTEVEQDLGTIETTEGLTDQIQDQIRARLRSDEWRTRQRDAIDQAFGQWMNEAGVRQRVAQHAIDFAAHQCRQLALYEEHGRQFPESQSIWDLIHRSAQNELRNILRQRLATVPGAVQMIRAILGPLPPLTDARETDRQTLLTNVLERDLERAELLDQLAENADPSLEGEALRNASDTVMDLGDRINQYATRTVQLVRDEATQIQAQLTQQLGQLENLPLTVGSRQATGLRNYLQEMHRRLERLPPRQTQQTSEAIAEYRGNEDAIRVGLQQIVIGETAQRLEWLTGLRTELAEVERSAANLPPGEGRTRIQREIDETRAVIAGQEATLTTLRGRLGAQLSADELTQVVDEYVRLAQARLRDRIQSVTLLVSLEEQLAVLQRQQQQISDANMPGLTTGRPTPDVRVLGLRGRIEADITQLETFVAQLDPQNLPDNAAFDAIRTWLDGRDAANLERGGTIELLSLYERQEAQYQRATALIRRAEELRGVLQGLPRPLDAGLQAMSDQIDLLVDGPGRQGTLAQQRMLIMQEPVRVMGQQPWRQDDTSADERRRRQDEGLAAIEENLRGHEQTIQQTYALVRGGLRGELQAARERVVRTADNLNRVRPPNGGDEEYRQDMLRRLETLESEIGVGLGNLANDAEPPLEGNALRDAAGNMAPRDQRARRIEAEALMLVQQEALRVSGLLTRRLDQLRHLPLLAGDPALTALRTELETFQPPLVDVTQDNVQLAARTLERYAHRENQLQANAQALGMREIQLRLQEVQQLQQRFDQVNNNVQRPLPQNQAALQTELTAVGDLLTDQTNRLTALQTQLGGKLTIGQVTEALNDNATLTTQRNGVPDRVTRLELYVGLQDQLNVLNRQRADMAGIGETNRPRDRRAMRTQIMREIRQVEGYIQQTDPGQPLNNAAFGNAAELLRRRDDRNRDREERLEVLRLETRQLDVVRQYNQLHQWATRLRDNLRAAPQPLNQQMAGVLQTLNAQVIPALEQERRNIVGTPAAVMTQFPFQQPDVNATPRRQRQDQVLNQAGANLLTPQQTLRVLDRRMLIQQRLEEADRLLRALEQRLNELAMQPGRRDLPVFFAVSQEITRERRQLDQDTQLFQNSTNNAAIQNVGDRWRREARNPRNAQHEQRLLLLELRNDILDVSEQLALVQEAQQIQNRPDLRTADARRLEQMLSDQLFQLRLLQQGLSDPTLTPADAAGLMEVGAPLVRQFRTARAPEQPRINALDAEARQWRVYGEHEREHQAVRTMQTTLAGLGALAGTHATRLTALQGALNGYQTQLTTNRNRLRSGQPLQPRELQTMEMFLDQRRGQRLQRQVDALTQEVNTLRTPSQEDVALHNQFMAAPPIVPPQGGGLANMHNRAATPALEAAAIATLVNNGAIPVNPLHPGVAIGRNPPAPVTPPGVPATPYGGQALFVGRGPDHASMRFAVYDAEGVQPRVYEVAHWLQGDPQLTRRLGNNPAPGALAGRITAQQFPRTERIVHKAMKTFGLK